MTNPLSHSHVHLHYEYTLDKTTRSLKREREKERDTRTQPTANLTLVSNNNDLTPQILRNQIRVTLTHTPALPIHNGRNYQELKREREKEKDTRTHPTARLGLKESEEESISN